MSLVIPFTFVGGPGNKAKASEVNANFQAVAAKFTTGAGGISAADIAIGAGIKGSGASNQLSTTPGERVGTASIEDDAINAAQLRDDATAGAPSAAVNTAAHIKDRIITAVKVVLGSLSKAELKVTEVTQAFSLVSAPTTFAGTFVVAASPALPLMSAMFPIRLTVENVVATAGTTRIVVGLQSSPSGVPFYAIVANNDISGSTTTTGTIRFAYLALT